MPEKNISDKALIRQYVELKKIRRQTFCRMIGLSRSFLDADSTITVENLRKIIFHPKFEDFNVDAFLHQEQNMVKEKGQISKEIINQLGLVEAMELVTRLKALEDDIDQEDARNMVTLLGENVRQLARLSEEYQKLYHEYKKLYGGINQQS